MGTKLNPNAIKQGSITYDKLNLKVGDLDEVIQNKVDKQDGKGLSTNDYTSTEKNKLAGIANGANVNVQPDWNVTDTSSDAYIKNKPSKVTETTVSGWGFTKNTGTVTSITPGTGLTGTSSDTAITTSGTINLKTATDAEIGGIKVGYSENGKNYPVELDANNKAYVNVPWTDNNTTSFTITASATDDDVVVLSGTNGSNKVTYDAKHRKQFGETTKVGADKYVSNNGTTSISGYGASGTIKIPQITVNEYGHVTAATDESVTITMPSAQTIPTTLKNPYSLKFGSKTYDGSSEKEITASDLGLSAALNYCGVTTTALTDGATTNPVVINGSNHTAKAGCTVFYGDKEFVFNGTSWEELGFSIDLSGYKTKQTAVSSPSASGSTTAFIDTISQDTNGKITVTKKNVDLSSKAPNNHASTATTYGVGTASNYGHVKLATGDMNGAANVDGVAVSKNHTHSQYSTTGHTHSYLPLSGGTLTGNLTFDCSNNVDRYITFDSASSSNAVDWRIGYLGSGNADANYLTFQSSHGSTADSVNWTDALKLGIQTFDATFAGNILPATNLSKNLGSSSRCFSKTYTRYVDTPPNYDLRLCSSGNELLTLGSATGNLHVTNSILPKTNANTNSNLGSSDAKWYNIFASDYIQGKYIKFDVENAFTTDISTTFRTSLLGRNTPEAFVRTARTGATAVGPFLEDYASFITWGCGDTHGFIQTSYNTTKKIKVGGGNKDNINWTVDLIHSDNYSNYCAPKTHTHSYLPLSGGTLNANSYIKLPNTSGIIQTTDTTSNAVASIMWYKGTEKDSTKKSAAQIGWHNTGGTNGSGSVYIIPNPQDIDPWMGQTGLYITETNLKFNNKEVSVSGHTHYYAASSSVGGSANTVNVSQSTGTSNFPVTFVSNNTVSSSSMFVGASNNLTFNPSTGNAKSKSFTAETKVTVGSSFIQYNSTTGCLEITA